MQHGIRLSITYKKACTTLCVGQSMKKLSPQIRRDMAHVYVKLGFWINWGKHIEQC